MKIVEENVKRAEVWSSSYEGRTPWFLPALLGNWVSYILPKEKKIDWYQKLTIESLGKIFALTNRRTC